MSTKYNEDSIEHYSGLDGVRNKCSVYIGPPDGNGIWTIWRECADNAVDEFLASRNNLVHLIEDTDGSYWCLDSGQGIPVGTKIVMEGRHKEKMSSLTLVVSKLHAGGKMKAGGAYETSRGTHGIGIKATSALSTEFQIWTFRDKSWHTTTFSKGKEKTGVTKCVAPKMPHGLPKLKNGTIVRFVPDTTIFGKSKLNIAWVKQWCEITSYLNGGLKVKLTTKDGKTQEWFTKRGAADYLDKQVEDLKCVPLGKNFSITTKEIDIAIAFTDAEGINVNAYTNGLHNVDGGVHVSAFYDALTKAIAKYKGARAKFTPSDLREGLVGVINFKIASPQFSSQTKEKLIDTRVAEPCFEIAFKELTAFFNQNKALAKRICQRADELKSLKDEFSQNKKVLKELSSAKKKNDLPDKFSAASKDCPANRREAYTVEGDSAGGCFTIETTIQLWDGTTKTFTQLIEDFENGIDNIGVSYDATNKKFVPFKIHHPRQTLNVTELIELTTDSGHVIRCTIDHPFMLEDGSYKRANQLTEDDVIREFQPFTTDAV